MRRGWRPRRRNRPADRPSRQVMTPAEIATHTTHDPELIAAAASGGATDAERQSGVVAFDVRCLSRASRRSRGHRGGKPDAPDTGPHAGLRPERGGRPPLARRGMARAARPDRHITRRVLQPLAVGLTTLGLAGLVLASGPSMLTMSASGPDTSLLACRRGHRTRRPPAVPDETHGLQWRRRVARVDRLRGAGRAAGAGLRGPVWRARPGRHHGGVRGRWLDPWWGCGQCRGIRCGDPAARERGHRGLPRRRRRAGSRRRRRAVPRRSSCCRSRCWRSASGCSSSAGAAASEPDRTARSPAGHRGPRVHWDPIPSPSRAGTGPEACRWIA